MILHDVANDAKVVEITSTTLRANVLFERDDDAIDAFPIPRRTEDSVSETKLLK